MMPFQNCILYCIFQFSCTYVKWPWPHCSPYKPLCALTFSLPTFNQRVASSPLKPNEWTLWAVNNIDSPITTQETGRSELRVEQEVFVVLYVLMDGWMNNRHVQYGTNVFFFFFFSSTLTTWQLITSQCRSKIGVCLQRYFITSHKEYFQLHEGHMRLSCLCS